MKRSKFSDSQIVDAVRLVEAGLGVPDICRKLGISTATFYKWRAKYGGMDVSMMSRMKELEEENRRLRKMYLEEKLKAEIVSEALEKSGEAISQKGDGQEGGHRARCVHSGSLLSSGWPWLRNVSTSATLAKGGVSFLVDSVGTIMHGIALLKNGTIGVDLQLLRLVGAIVPRINHGMSRRNCLENRGGTYTDDKDLSLYLFDRTTFPTANNSLLISLKAVMIRYGYQN